MAEGAEQNMKSCSGASGRPKITHEQEDIHCVTTKESYCPEQEKVDFAAVIEAEVMWSRLEEIG